MSTHIPADYFTKPILARLGVGKSPGSWAVFAAETGATVAVFPFVGAPEVYDDETAEQADAAADAAADARDRGGRW